MPELPISKNTEVTYNYEAQLWVKDGIVQPCGHPETMRSSERYCCAADRYKGCGIEGVVKVLRLAAAAE